MSRTFSPHGRPTRVVVLVDTLARPGGGERLAVENALRLDPERHQVTFCISRWEDSLEEREPAAAMLAKLRGAGVEVLGLPRGSRLALGAWAPLVRRLRGGVDVVHGHIFGSNVWAALLGTLSGTPAVVAHEHMWAYGGGRGDLLRAAIDRDVVGRLSDAFIAVSEEGRRRMIEVERVDPRRIVVIPNGIAGFEPGDGARVRAELGIAAEAPVICSVGHLRPEKAFEVLVDAAAGLTHPEATVLIVGEGPERERLEARIAAAGLTGRALLLGPREDVPDLLAAADVAVCCSDFEGGPLSVMEYMEAALPVVATDVGGLPELVLDGETGLLVAPRRPDLLAAALDQLLADPERRAAMGRRGREERRRRWDLGVWGRRLEDLYQELLTRAG